MPEAENRLALMQEARDEALATIVEADREAKASILQPAIGREMAPHERLTAQTTYLSDMLLTGLQFDELTATFQLRDDKPVPKRHWHRARSAARELEAEEQKRARPDAV